MEPNFGQAGPLLGSCLSSPSSPAIVSRANSLRLSLGDELPGHVIDGDASSERGCSGEEEVTSLERDIFGEDAFFELQEANAGASEVSLWHGFFFHIKNAYAQSTQHLNQSFIISLNAQTT